MNYSKTIILLSSWLLSFNINSPFCQAQYDQVKAEVQNQGWVLQKKTRNGQFILELDSQWKSKIDTLLNDVNFQDDLLKIINKKYKEQGFYNSHLDTYVIHKSVKHGPREIIKIIGFGDKTILSNDEAKLIYDWYLNNRIPSQEAPKVPANPNGPIAQDPSLDTSADPLDQTHLSNLDVNKNVTKEDIHKKLQEMNKVLEELAEQVKENKSSTNSSNDSKNEENHIVQGSLKDLNDNKAPLDTDIDSVNAVGNQAMNELKDKYLSPENANQNDNTQDLDLTQEEKDLLFGNKNNNNNSADPELEKILRGDSAYDSASEITDNWPKDENLDGITN